MIELRESERATEEERERENGGIQKGVSGTKSK